MNEKTLTYRPNSAYRFFIPFFVLATVFSAVMGFVLPNGKDRILFLVLTAGGGLLTCFLVRESAVTFSFGKGGIEFAVFGKTKHCHPWSAFSHTYIVRNVRGFSYIVLSPRELPPKEQKRIIYLRTIYTKARKDGILAISLDQRFAGKLECVLGEYMKQVKSAGAPGKSP